MQPFVKKHNNEYNLNTFLTHASSWNHLCVIESEALTLSTIVSIKLGSLVNLDSIDLYEQTLQFYVSTYINTYITIDSNLVPKEIVKFKTIKMPGQICKSTACSSSDSSFIYVFFLTSNIPPVFVPGQIQFFSIYKVVCFPYLSGFHFC